MSDNILDSYMIKLGALVDEPSARKFVQTLKVFDDNVLSFSTKSIGNFIKVESSVIGLFTAIGTGLIAMADKTAMADQGYRLLGMRMLMTKDSARAMKLAQDELGASLDEIAYDPELNKRFQYLYEQNMKLGAAMGPNFEKNAKAVRDIRMEVNLLSTEFDFMISGAIMKFFEKFNGGTNTLQGKLHDLNDWFTDELPHWSDQVSDIMIPVWGDFVGIMTDLKSIALELGHDFTYLIGVISGDKSLQTQTTNFQQFAIAIGDCVKWLAEFIHLTLVGTRAIIGLGEGIVQGLKNHKLPDFTKHQGKDGKITFDVWGDGGKDRNSQYFDNLVSNLDYNEGKDHSRATAYKNGDIPSIIMKASAKYGIDPNFLSALIHRESNYNPGVVSNKGAMGLMQLMPATAKQYGADNAFDPNQNIDAGSHLLSDLIKKYNGDPSKVLAAYNAGQSNVDKYGGVPPFQETQDYVKNILKDYARYSQASQSTGEQVHIGSISIVVPHNLPEAQWGSLIREAMTAEKNKASKNAMAQTAGGAYH
jgi:hypothetical protein